MRTIALAGLILAVEAAGASFTTPAGCTALAPAPNVTGVHCFGSFNTVTGPATVSGSFSGGGSGPLWSDTVTFEWDFETSSLITRAVQITASLNGSVRSTSFLATTGPQQHTGSFTLPIAYGENLSAWSFSLFVGTATPDGSIAIRIPATGAGLRLLVTSNPSAANVPEPGSAFLVVAGASALLVRRKDGL